MEKDTQKCDKNRRKSGQQLDGNDPYDIEGIFFSFLPPVEPNDFQEPIQLKNSMVSPTGQG